MPLNPRAQASWLLQALLVQFPHCNLALLWSAAFSMPKSTPSTSLTTTATSTTLPRSHWPASPLQTSGPTATIKFQVPRLHNHSMRLPHHLPWPPVPQPAPRTQSIILLFSSSYSCSSCRGFEHPDLSTQPLAFRTILPPPALLLPGDIMPVAALQPATYIT